MPLGRHQRDLATSPCRGAPSHLVRSRNAREDEPIIRTLEHRASMASQPRGERERRSPLGMAALFALSTAVACGTAQTKSPPHSHTTGTTTSSGSGDGPNLPEDHPSSDPCVVFPQSGCAADHTCVIATLDGATLCEGAGDSPVGGSCANNGDCQAGLACVGRSCRSFCAQASDCGKIGPACFDVYSDKKPISGWRSCAVHCNPADPQNAAGAEGIVACPAGLGCFTLPSDVGPQGSTDCYSVGAVAAGGSCNTPSDCGAGLVCLNNGGSTTCERMCLLGSSQCSCSSFAEPEYVALSSGLVEVGYCQ
jgi:hypothetical protein